MKQFKQIGKLPVGGAEGAILRKKSSNNYDVEWGHIHPWRYGIRIDKNDSNPDTRVTYLYDAVGMTPAYMDFATGEFNYGSWRSFCEWLNAPVMLNYDGSVAHKLDRNDQTKKADGTASDIGNTAFDGNAMSQFRRLWLKQYEDANYEYIIFSNIRYDDDCYAWAFTDADGNVRDCMYYAMYEGNYIAPRLRSLATGTVTTSQTGQDEIERAEANGAGWYINYHSQRDFIKYLLWMISKSTADQAKFGNGNSGSARHLAPGTLKEAGQFFGYDSTNQAVKVFYIENFWGNYWKRMAGMIMALDGEIHTKMIPPYPSPELPGENVMPDGYTPTGVTPSGTYSMYLKDAVVLNNAGFIPFATGGSATEYYTCGLWYTIGTTIKYARAGGFLYGGALCGAGSVFLAYPLSFASSYSCAALSFLESAS